MAGRNGGISIDLNLSALVHLLERSPELAGKGAERAMDDIKDDWVREARDVAPLDTGNLRRQIDGEAEKKGLDSEVIVVGNASARGGGGRFNYGYFIHEGHMAEKGRKLRHPGTVEKFLEEPAEANKQRYLEMIEDEIEEELRRGGW